MRTLKTFVVAVSVSFMAQMAVATDFDAGGGAGDNGGQGGSLELHSAGGIKAGGTTKIKFPKNPKVKANATLTATDVDVDLTIDVADLDASTGDLDPDLFEVTTRRDFFVPTGTTLNIEGDVTVISTKGSIVVGGTIQDGDGVDTGVNVSLHSVGRSVIIAGTVEVDGEAAANGGDAGNIDFQGLNIVVGSTATISAQGGATTGVGDGGNGGDFDADSFRSVIQRKRIFVGFGPNTTVDLRGGSGDTGGNGGNFDVDYENALGKKAKIALTGSIDVRGGAGIAAGTIGGDGGDIDGDVGGSITLSGTFNARGGAGAAGTDGGDGGQISFGRRSPGERAITILGDQATNGQPVTIDVTGGNGAVNDGNTGGSVVVVTDERGIAWTGDILANGGTSADGDGADGGSVSFTSFGEKKGSVSIEGDVSTFGSDAGTDGVGSAGGDVDVVSLDGSISVIGDIDSSAGDAIGANNDAAGNGGHVYLLIDDTNGLPATGVGGIDLSDDEGGSVMVIGAIATDGGDAVAGNANGSDAGAITIDTDSDDGEEKKNGGGVLVAGSTVSAVGGDGVGTGSAGNGGDVTLRASNGLVDGTATGFTITAGVTVTNVAGTGGVGGGAAGTTVND